MANLYQVIVGIIDKRTTRPGTPTADDLYQPGTVTAVNPDGTYTVSVAGNSMVANPETDQPLSVGQPVYVSTVRNGRPLVHGPR